MVEEDDDDDAPLVSQLSGAGKQNRKTEEEEEEEDDDKPLATMLAPARAKPTRGRAAPRASTPRKPTTPRVKTAPATPRSGGVKRELSSPSASTRRRKPPSDEEPDSDGTRPVFKAGQIRVCPPLGDPQRAFYESLLEENARSIIGVKYCVEHGVLLGTLAREKLAHYKRLREAGAFKQLGGVKQNMIEHLF